jgi:cell division protein FtsB
MKKIIFIIVVISLLLIINNLVRSMYDVWQKRDFVTQAQKQLDFQKQENQRLKATLSYSQTQEFIEKQARDKLFMVKAGEQKVLIPQEDNSQVVQEDNSPNWKKWWNLFFN